MSPLWLRGGFVREASDGSRALAVDVACRKSGVLPPQSMVAMVVSPHFGLEFGQISFYFPAMTKPRTPWPHAPLHRLSEQGTYFVTAGTYLRQHHFRGRDRLVVLQRGLLTVCDEFGWALEAWAVFSNHYHFVAHSPFDQPTADSLRDMLGKLHGKTAAWLNRLDKTAERKVWHNYRETRLTFEKSYLARLNYTHQNAVKHGLVMVANQYPWCSAAWFERTATPAQVKTLYSFKTDRLETYDAYTPAPEW